MSQAESGLRIVRKYSLKLLNIIVGSDSVADDGSTVKSGEESMRKLEGLKNDNLEMAVLIQRIEREKNDYAVWEVKVITDDFLTVPCLLNPGEGEGSWATIITLNEG